MAGPTPSYSQSTPCPAISVISPQYCLPHPINLEIVKKVFTTSIGNFDITDTTGNILFKVKGVFHKFFDNKRVLLDAIGNPMVTLQQKAMSAHSRWEVFKGESTEPKDLLFSAKTSSLFYVKTHLHVFLANTTNEDVCDFRVEGTWSQRSGTIYVGETPNVIAQLHKKETVQNLLKGKDSYMVTAYPNVDYAFIVSLIVILYEINTASQP